MLSTALPQRSETGLRGRSAGKVASGGLGTSTALRLRKRPSASRDFSQFETKPRWSSANPQTPKVPTPCDPGQSAALMETGATMLEHGTGVATIGSNGKIYTSGWAGGSRASISTIKIGSIGNGLGMGATGLSTAIDINQWRTGEIGTTHLGINTGVTALGMRGGPWGAGFAAVYSLVDEFFPTVMPAIWKTLSTPDKRVVECPSLFVK